MSLHAILVTKNSIDKIAEVNAGLRPKIEEIPTIFIRDDDPRGYNDVMSQGEFYWNWADENINITDTDWTEIQKF